LSYDPTKIQLNSAPCPTKNGVCQGQDGLNPTVNTGTPGQIRVSAFDPDGVGVGPGTALQMLVINFTTLNAAGSTSVGLTVTKLADQAGATIGTPKGAGSTVTITGGTPPPADVPNVVGKTQAAAKADIEAAGRTVGTVTFQSSATVPRDSVISQNPLPGPSPDLTVDLTVSSGPPPVGGAPIPTLSEWALLLLSLLLGGVLWRTHARRANFHA